MATRHFTLPANFSSNGVVDTGIVLKSTEYPTKIDSCSKDASFQDGPTTTHASNVFRLYFVTTSNGSGGTQIQLIQFTLSRGARYIFMGQ